MSFLNMDKYCSVCCQPLKYGEDGECERCKHSAEITLFKKPNDPNERVNKPNYNPPSFEDFDK